MKTVVFSDVHSNEEALDRFFEEITKFSHDRLVCLGDVVGYGASPNECVERIRGMEIISILGNHDYYVARNETADEKFNKSAAAAVRWQIGVVTDENKRWLDAMPAEFYTYAGFGKYMFVHGSPVRKFDYIMHNMDARRALITMMRNGVAVAFVGHTHRPGAWRYMGIRKLDDKRGRYDYYEDLERDEQEVNREIEESEEVSCGSAVEFKTDDRVVVNVGSIGQPRDGDPRGCFVVFDDEALTVEFHRFEYPFQEAQRKILDAGLPPRLAERLGRGC